MLLFVIGRYELIVQRQQNMYLEPCQLILINFMSEYAYLDLLV